MTYGWVPPIAAGLEELVIPAIVLLFLLIGGLQQWLSKIAEAGRAEEARRRRGAAAPGGGKRGVPAGQDSLRREVDDFVRSVKRPGDAARPGTTGASQRSRQTEPPAARQPGRPSRPDPFRPAGRAGEQPVDVEPVEPLPEAEDPRGTQRIGGLAPARGLGAFTSGFGAGLTGAGAMEEHLHEMFDHELGTLRGRLGELGEPADAIEGESLDEETPSLPPTAAAGLAVILADPVSLRQAVILNEILQRPEHRWE